MTNKSSIYSKHGGYTNGYLQMIFGKKRKALKAKRKQKKRKIERDVEEYYKTKSITKACEIADDLYKLYN